MRRMTDAERALLARVLVSWQAGMVWLCFWPVYANLLADLGPHGDLS